jgi:microcystin-dependent protein
MDGDAVMAGVQLFAGTFPPKNWEFCQGQVLPISENAALFSLLGNQYGGDGITTFGLPNLAPVATAGPGQPPMNYIICVSGTYPARHDQ